VFVRYLRDIVAVSPPETIRDQGALLASTSETADSLPVAHLGLADAISIMFGIVVGTAIFKTPTLVFQNVDYEWQSYVLWLLGGLLSLCGALCYAELATSFSRNGGEYIFLSRAYGSWLGFLFGWAQLTAVHSGTVGTMAYAFADYSMNVFALPEWSNAWLAAGAIGFLTLLNLGGATTGRTVQNILSGAKVLGLLLLILVGVATPVSEVSTPTAPQELNPQFGLALVFVLYAYGGWNDTAYVAAEVRDRACNLPRALFIGMSGITIIYLLVNFACIRTLGLDAARMTYTPAADVVESAFGSWGAKATSLLVMVSALGAINAMIFTGSRIYCEISRDYPVFRRAARPNKNPQIPQWALIAPGLFACVLILAVGTGRGQNLIDAALSQVSLPAIPWTQYFGGFETLVAATAPVFWTFFLLSGLSLFVLRRVEPERESGFRVPWYPLPPMLFCMMSSYMLYSSITYAKWLSLMGFVPLIPGVLLYLLSRRLELSDV
jgi:APA family basic amino acid/polyamine antiporter